MVGEAEITMRGAADRAGKGRATAMPSTDPSIIRVSIIGTTGANPAGKEADATHVASPPRHGTHTTGAWYLCLVGPSLWRERRCVR